MRFASLLVICLSAASARGNAPAAVVQPGAPTTPVVKPARVKRTRGLYDSKKKRAAWTATLRTPPQRTVDLDEKKAFLPKVGAFGTVGESKWRGDMISLFKLLHEQQNGPDKDSETVAKELVFNPQLPAGTWTPKFATEEAKHLAKDRVIVFGLTKKYSSVGSMAELGFVAALSFLKSRKTLAFIHHADDALGDNVGRARSMSMVDARYVEQMIPESFHFSRDQMQALTDSFSEQVKFGKFLKSPIGSQIQRRFQPRKDIKRRVALSGSSSNQDSPDRMVILDAMKKAGIEVYDTWHPNWTLEHYEQKEIPEKDRSLVNTVLITDQTSFGALKDVGLAVFRAVANGTYAVISFPEPHGPKDEYARARALAVAHWKQLKKEFPWVEHYVKFVRTPKEMAQVATQIVRAQDPVLEPTIAVQQ